MPGCCLNLFWSIALYRLRPIALTSKTSSFMTVRSWAWGMVWTTFPVFRSQTCRQSQHVHSPPRGHGVWSGQPSLCSGHKPAGTVHHVHNTPVWEQVALSTALYALAICHVHSTDASGCHVHDSCAGHWAHPRRKSSTNQSLSLQHHTHPRRKSSTDQSLSLQHQTHPRRKSSTNQSLSLQHQTHPDSP